MAETARATGGRAASGAAAANPGDDEGETVHWTGPELADTCRALLSASTREGWPEPPLLLALPWGDPWRVDAQGFDIEVLPLGGLAEPLEALCRIPARPEVEAYAILADGWAVDDHVDAGVDWDRLQVRGGLAARESARRVRVLNAAARTGAAAVALSSGSAVTAHGIDDAGAEGGPTGPLCDGLRRLFGLPTPPCPVDVVEMWAVLWLERVLATAPVPATWAEVAALHPASVTASAGAPLAPSVLERAGRGQADRLGWAQVREFAAQEGWLGVSPAVAAWADAPMFARLVLRDLAPLWLVLGQVEERVAPGVGRSIRRVLRGWGLEPDGLLR